MKKSKLIPLLLAAAMALPFGASAEEGHPGRDDRSAGDHRPGPGRGFHGGPHGGPSLHFLRGLDLSDSQEDKVFQLLHAQAPHMREQQRAHEKAMRALHDMRNADKFDDAAAVKLAQSAAQAQANIMLAQLRTHQKVLSLLTPEQRAQLAERSQRGGFNER
jgi:periplasmic protein CpxP/Spy